MTGTYFVDTNLLVYFRDSSEPEKQAKAAAWLDYLWKKRVGALSVQVLNEYYTIVTRKLEPGLSQEDARSDVSNLFTWRPLKLDETVIRNAWQAQDRYSVSWWDALIISAAQIQANDYLLTEDLQDGQDLAGLVIRNPFLHDPPPASS
ncbi:MAG TPA: PIN domain-containing protein [Acidobacteriota bacterium]|nr:PIN domain-containing protein [Acidobacteriota bacterium]